MAAISLKTIDLISKTIKKLRATPDYQWGHMGSCNCGHLAQVVSGLSKSEIHQRAMQKYGDWNEQINGYCEGSGYPLDEIISNLTSNGFSLEDLKHLEKLSDPQILSRIQKPVRDKLRHNNIQDVILYLKTWSDFIEDELSKEIESEIILKINELEIA